MIFKGYRIWLIANQETRASGPFALRDHALLLFLYNTGARVQEAADLRVAHLDLFPQPRVRLHGKGDKWRVCPLWGKTASLLQQLLEKQSSPSSPEAPVFTSRKGSALTRFGIYKIVRRHTVQVLKRVLMESPERSPRISFATPPPFICLRPELR